MSDPASTPGPRPGLVQATLGASVAAATIGVAYGFVLAWIPHAYLLTPLAALGFGSLVARVAEQLLTAGRIPHRGARTWLPLLAGTLGFYVAWIAWIATVHHDRAAFQLVWSPPTLVLNMRLIASFGTWELLGWRPPWYDLYSMWFCEALVYFLTLHTCTVNMTRRFDEQRTRAAEQLQHSATAPSRAR